MLRVGMLTSGGDCQGLNAAMRGVAKTLYELNDDVEILGYQDGFRGLIEGDYKLMKPSDFSGILTLGGTILGTSRQPFKEIDNYVNGKDGETRCEAMVRKYKEQNLDCLVVLGGNGSHKSANRLSEEGLNVITLPKTIDKDIYGSEMTFGFQSAVNIATDVIDGIHTTATSHGRIFIIELMGNKAGWLTLSAGVAGGADIILIPEINYELENVLAAIEERNKQGKKFSIIAMAEGSKSKEDSEMSSSDYAEMLKEKGYPSGTYKLAAELSKELDQEVRVTVPGHYQRGGSPCPYDRVFASECGAYGAELILKGKFGRSVVQVNNEITSLPIDEVAGKKNLVPTNCELVRVAKDMGISFGDE